MCVDSLKLRADFNNAQTDHEHSPYKDPSIYVICKDARKIGVAHGAWINALQSPDRVMEDIYAVLTSSPATEADDWEIAKIVHFGECTVERNENLDSVCSKAQWAQAQKQKNGRTPGDEIPRATESPWHPSDENYSDVDHEDFFDRGDWEEDEDFEEE